MLKWVLNNLEKSLKKYFMQINAAVVCVAGGIV